MRTNKLKKYQGPLRLRSTVPDQYQEGNRVDGYPEITLNDRNENGEKDFPENALYTTKYTIWSFLPKFFFEQFRKATSIYFLIICIIVSIPQVAPFNPLTSWAGLIFILCVTAIREAYEDYLRLKADMKVNNTKYTTILSNSGEHKNLRAFEIQVGDLLFITADERIPVDCVVLSTAKPDGTCFIETAQLDGETNLKLRKSANAFTHEASAAELSSLKGTLIADVPNHHLYQFKGSLSIDSYHEKISLDANHLLLASSVLKNTDWVIGLCVYTGPETKVGLNLKLPPSKFSRLDKKLNTYILFIFCVKMFFVVILTILNVRFIISPEAVYQNLVDSSESEAVAGIKIFVTYFALLSYLIPISLVVTLDIVRFAQATFIKWDISMMHDGKKANAKTSNLNDELSLVEYIFSDKTGTLTENIMIFRKASINGSIFEDSADTGTLCNLITNPIDDKSKKFTRHYLYILALAHSCQYDEIEDIYKSASPDEEALCRAAKKNGFVFKGREGARAILNVFEEDENFEILVENEFTSQRRRMSVIVRTPSGRIFLYIKGADSVIADRLKDTKANKIRLRKTLEDLEKFSVQGLRTLLLGYKEMSEDEFQSYWSEFNEANNLIDNREEEVDRVCSKLEQDIILVGATAIEDSLQYGVPDTIFNLRKAGIKIWVITGDKQETAINIGYSSNLLSSDTNVVVLNADNDDSTAQILTQTWKNINDDDQKRKPFSLVVDGHTLTYVLANHREAFLRLAARCETAICNRVTPLQKAEVVNLIQSGFQVVCLSVGDGGNDVSMIQQAQIGVGIKGREGAQAARAADFAIPQFRHLEKLLLVHGRYALLRNTKVIYHSFYKNAAVFLVIAWHSFFDGASGMPIYGDWIMTFYNIIFTSLPVFAIGIFEKDLHEDIISRHPEMYQSHKRLNFWSLFRWLANAIFHSLFIFWFSWSIFYVSGEVLPLAQSSGFRVFGTFTITIGFHIVLAKLLFETNHWVSWTAMVYILSILGFYSWEIIESFFVPEYYGVFILLLSTPLLWLSLLWVIPGSLFVDFVLKYIHRQMYPKPWYILQEKYLDKEPEGNMIELASDSRKQPLL